MIADVMKTLLGVTSGEQHDTAFEFNEDESSSLFRPISYDRDIFVCDDQTAGISFLCNPIAGWDETVIAGLNLLFSQDPYPEFSTLSVSLFGGPDIKPYLRVSDQLRRGIKDELMRKAHNANLGFLWGGTTNPIEITQGVKVKNMQLIVTFKMPIDSILITEPEITRLTSIKRLMKERLSQAGAAPTLIDEKLYMNVLSPMFHWKDNAEWKNKNSVDFIDELPINAQILQYDTSINKDHDGIRLESGDKKIYFKMLTAKGLPKDTFFGAASRWYGDFIEGRGCVNQNFIITTNIVYAPHGPQKTRLETKKGSYLRNRGWLSKIAPKVGKIADQLEDVSNAVDDGSRLVKATISAGVFGYSENDASEGVTSLQTYMVQSGMNMVNEDSFSIPSFVEMMPFGACSKSLSNGRYFSLATKHLPYVIPIFGEWKGTRTPTIQLVSRSGQIMNFDLFDSDTNYNTLIYAESGSGKSFLTNEIIRSYRSTGNKVWAIDAGESYKKLSSALNGSFTAFGDESETGKQLSCNPFTMIPENDPKAFSDSLEMLAGCILAMAFTTQAPTDLQAAQIEKILVSLWEKKGQKTTIDDVEEACLRDEDKRIQDIGKQLYAFTTKGQFGHYFDKPHNIEFTTDFNVLELDGLSKTPRLQAVVLFMLMVQISQSMYEEFKLDRNIKRIVIIDEAWDLLANSIAVAAFMEKGFRRFRKYNGAGIVVTQSIMDLQKTDAGRAIAENAANSLILKQKESTIINAEKEDLMSIGSYGYQMLKKVTTRKGHYSEVFINTNQGMGVGRLIVDPLRILMYSTSPDDNKLIDNYVDQGLTLSDSMIRVVQDKQMIRYPIKRPIFLDHRIRLLDTQLATEQLAKSTFIKQTNSQVFDETKYTDENAVANDSSSVDVELKSI